MRPACVGHLSAAPKLFFQVARGPSVPRAFRAPRRFRPARRPLCACGAGLPCEGRAVRATLTRASTVPNFSRFLREKSHQRAILCAHRWCALRTIDKRARCPPSGRWLGATRGACHKVSRKSRPSRLRRRCAALTFVCLCGVLPNAWPLALPPKLRPPERMRDFPPSVPQGGDAVPKLQICP